jgi:hypothetical protein
VCGAPQAERGIEALCYYPYRLHQTPLFKRIEQPPLPLNPQMIKAEIGYVIKTVVNLEQH